jgi:hypothetical protein
MEKFIKRLILFVLPIVLFMVFAEILFRHIPNQYSYNANYLEAHGNEIEILILGNSHSLFGIDADEFSRKAFNAAHVSQTLDLDYAILQKYSDKLSNLKTVIIPISYFSLFEKLLEFGVEKWRAKDYYIYYSLNVPVSFENRFEIFSKGNDQKLKDYILGEAYRPQADLYKSGKTAAKRHTIEKDTAQMIFPEMRSYMESVIKFCQKKNCQVILLTMPAWHTYRENMDAWQWQKTLETAQALEKQYENVRYFNFIFDSQFIANDFGDADHLNPQGARKISKILDSLNLAED